ncbi:MAG TPA: cation:proton antiporter [Gammaproteobacteria bacterium]
METHQFFLQLMLILLAARLLAEAAGRLHAPPVIGELCAGLLLGPSLLGWIKPSEVIQLLAGIGIILLLFEVGLETDLQRLLSSGRQSLLVAITGFALPFVLGSWLAYSLFAQPLVTALFIGGTLTATSIGITVRVLTDLQRQHSSEGQVILGAAVLDDILGVILLALLYEFATSDGDIAWGNAGKILLFVAVFFFLAPGLAKLFSLLIRRFEKGSVLPGLIPTTIVSLVLFFAWLAFELGVPELLGGFAAGLALSRRFFLPFGIALANDPDFARRIEQQMRPIIHLFTPIFFVMVGLSLNLHEIDWGSPFIWSFSAAILLVAILGKLAGALLLRVSWYKRLIIGSAMVPRGEVGLIFAELGRASGIFSNEIYAGMVMVIAITTLAAPFVLKSLYRRLPDEVMQR